MNAKKYIQVKALHRTSNESLWKSVSKYSPGNKILCTTIWWNKNVIQGQTN